MVTQPLEDSHELYNDFDDSLMEDQEVNILFEMSAVADEYYLEEGFLEVDIQY